MYTIWYTISIGIYSPEPTKDENRTDMDGQTRPRYNCGEQFAIRPMASGATTFLCRSFRAR